MEEAVSIVSCVADAWVCHCMCGLVMCICGCHSLSVGLSGTAKKVQPSIFYIQNDIKPCFFYSPTDTEFL